MYTVTREDSALGILYESRLNDLRLELIEEGKERGQWVSTQKATHLSFQILSNDPRLTTDGQVLLINPFNLTLKYGCKFFIK